MAKKPTETKSSVVNLADVKPGTLEDHELPGYVKEQAGNPGAAVVDEKPQDKPQDKPSKGVEKLDMTKPFAIILHQTESRNHFEIVTGADCVAKAEAIAAGLALNQGRTVAVFGPQAKVKVPPAVPMADDLKLDF